MSKGSFTIPFNLKIKEPRHSKLYIHVKPTDDYATLKEIFDKLVKRYNYQYEFKNDKDDEWIFQVSKLNDMYNTFVHDLVKYAKRYKIKSVTSNDKTTQSQLYIDFILPNHNLYGKYKLNKYGDPEYKSETKTAEYIINKMMTETFKKDISQHVHRVDKTRYGIAYDVFENRKKMTINDWRKFYHKLYYLQQMFMDLKIKIQSNNSDYKQLVKCLHDPELLFKGKNLVEFEFPRYNLGINDELNKIMKKVVVKKDDYFKDLPETTNYNESRRFVLKNSLTDKQTTELKNLVKKIKGADVKLYINNKQV